MGVLAAAYSEIMSIYICIRACLSYQAVVNLCAQRSCQAFTQRAGNLQSILLQKCNCREMAVRVLRLIPIADSRTERLHILQPAPVRTSCIACMCTLFRHRCYLPASQQNIHCPSSSSSCTKMNSEKIVATASDQRNTE